MKSIHVLYTVSLSEPEGPVWSLQFQIATFKLAGTAKPSTLKPLWGPDSKDPQYTADARVILGKDDRLAGENLQVGVSEDHSYVFLKGDT